MPENNIPLTDLPRALSALGVSISYPTLWRRTVQGIFPAQKINRQWFVAAADLPQIAATLAKLSGR